MKSKSFFRQIQIAAVIALVFSVIILAVGFLLDDENVTVLSLHDFRVVFGETHTNMIFDVVVPFEFYLSDSETTKLIQEKVWDEFGKNYFVVITIDKPAVRV